MRLWCWGPFQVEGKAFPGRIRAWGRMASATTKERTVSLAETARKQLDTRRKRHALDADQETEPNRSRCINLLLEFLILGEAPTDEDRELLEALLRPDLETSGVDAFVERTADSKGRVRLGGTDHAGKDFLVVAVGDGDQE